MKSCTRDGTGTLAPELWTRPCRSCAQWHAPHLCPPLFKYIRKKARGGGGEQEKKERGKLDTCLHNSSFSSSFSVFVLTGEKFCERHRVRRAQKLEDAAAPRRMSALIARCIIACWHRYTRTPDRQKEKQEKRNKKKKINKKKREREREREREKRRRQREARKRTKGKKKDKK